jgi:predicted PhzF superfamily epimerase YddE/YHI9
MKISVYRPKSEDMSQAMVSIVHSQGEIEFAGVAVLATVAFLNSRVLRPASVLQARRSRIETWVEEDITWVRSSRSDLPRWQLIELANPRAIDEVTAEDGAKLKHTLLWAWSDKLAGRIRARTFAPDWDIPESEGNGSGAMLLSLSLGIYVEITHGKGSVMYARPAEVKGQIELGGRVVMEKLSRLPEL